MRTLLLSVFFTGFLMFGISATAGEERIVYLGPAGSWSHQASLDLYGARELTGMSREEWIAAYNNKQIDKLVLPVATSVVGVELPYMDDALNLKNPIIVAEYPKMLSYALLAKPGAKFENIKRVLAHPVAHEEVKPWMDKEMPTVERVNAITGGAAAKAVAEGNSYEVASMGPTIGVKVYDLVPLKEHIEEGPHNVTRWWVLGLTPAKPTGNDKTTLLAEVNDSGFNKVLREMVRSDIKILNIYERPNKKSLDGHKYIIEVEGHAKVGKLKDYLQSRREVMLLGSYPRRY